MAFVSVMSYCGPFTFSITDLNKKKKIRFANFIFFLKEISIYFYDIFCQSHNFSVSSLCSQLSQGLSRRGVRSEELLFASSQRVFVVLSDSLGYKKLPGEQFSNLCLQVETAAQIQSGPEVSHGAAVGHFLLLLFLIYQMLRFVYTYINKRLFFFFLKMYWMS